MKKLSKTLCTLTALALVAACNKEADPGAPAPAAKTNFAVSLPGALETYAVEDPQAAGQITPYYDNVVVYLVDAGENAVGYAWTDAEIKARQKRFEQIVEPTLVGVFVNSGSITLPTGPISLVELNGFVQRLAVADQNKPVKTLAVADSKGNAAGDYLSVQQVTLMGQQTTFTTETSDDGHTLKKAAVELESLVARIEAGTVKAGTGLDALTVEAVYINNFNNDYARSSEQCFTSALIPHIIYKVSGTVSAGYKLADGTGDADNPTPFTGKYITVKGLVENGIPLRRIYNHTIYKMGLENGGIEITPDKITDNPEKTKIDLIVAVTVADWTVSNVTPEF